MKLAAQVISLRTLELHYDAYLIAELHFWLFLFRSYTFQMALEISSRNEKPHAIKTPINSYDNVTFSFYHYAMAKFLYLQVSHTPSAILLIQMLQLTSIEANKILIAVHFNSVSLYN